MTVIDDFARTVPAWRQAEIKRIRKFVKELVPDTEDVISFRVPAFRYRKKTLLWVGVFKHHMSLVPGHIKFTEGEPLPDALIKDFIEQRKHTIDESYKRKEKRA